MGKIVANSPNRSKILNWPSYDALRRHLPLDSLVCGWLEEQWMFLSSNRHYVEAKDHNHSGNVFRGVMLHTPKLF